MCNVRLVLRVEIVIVEKLVGQKFQELLLDSLNAELGKFQSNPVLLWVCHAAKQLRAPVRIFSNITFNK